MIRAAGVLAMVATALILALFLRTLRSAEVTATVVRGESWKIADGSSDSLPIHVGLPALPPGDSTRRLNDAGMRFIGFTDVGGIPTAWTLLVPPEVAEATRAGDELAIRSRQLKLKWVGRWTTTRYELRRGPSVQVFNGPENNKFALIVAVILGGPISLWGLAAVISGLSGDRAKRRRGPSTTLPGSPGIPGSP